MFGHTNVSRKTAEPIEMPFGVADLGGPKEPCIRLGRDPPRERQFWGVVQPIGKALGSLLRCTQRKRSFNLQTGLSSRYAELETEASIDDPGFADGVGVANIRPPKAREPPAPVRGGGGSAIFIDVGLVRKERGAGSTRGTFSILLLSTVYKNQKKLLCSMGTPKCVGSCSAPQSEHS